MKIILSLLLVTKYILTQTPVVIWPGLGSTLHSKKSIVSFKNMIEENIPGVYVHLIHIGHNRFEDSVKSIWSNINNEIEFVCEDLKLNSNLINGYNAIGFSQGSQFLRALAQRCSYPKMKNLISLGGQHQGFFVYMNIIQTNIVQASYWHDPLNEHDYKNYNLFLADINQEKKFNLNYKLNLMSLENLVLVKFDKDEVIYPRESQWFGFYARNNLKKIYTMEESVLYVNDTLGLKTLDRMGRIHKISIPGQHLQFSNSWFIESILKPFLI
ncbi:unnamed protein product [Brachionus calyciflorus]|uniref:Palmitoyl-protein thioesterase 1 n=1 Tax=Brachionus calyciflorus TaxID=104777 RepID=A0A814M2J9_9BILA|nr:unnamed protein product [Brachionus calyciflorus]